VLGLITEHVLLKKPENSLRRLSPLNISEQLIHSEKLLFILIAQQNEFFEFKV
jgi:hypothetical protein